MDHKPTAVRLTALVLGALLGASATRLVLRSAPTSERHTVPAAATGDALPVLGPPPLPSRLSAPEADNALAAYLALPPIATDAPPSEIIARARVLRALLVTLPTEHFERLFAALATRLGAAEDRLRWIAFEIWTERDAPAAARWASALVPGEAIDARSRVLYAEHAFAAWAEFDFAAAYAFASAQPDAELVKTLARHLLGQLAATDPTRALALAETYGTDRRFLDWIKRDIFDTWSRHDPAGAFQTMGADQLGQRRYEVTFQDRLTTWLGRDPRSALAWLFAQPDPDVGTWMSISGSALGTAIGELDDPRPLADALVAQADNLPNATASLAAFLSCWSWRDARSALAWIGSIPDAARRADLLEQAIPAQANARSAETFLPLALRLPAGEARDTRVATLLEAWTREAPDAALAWLATQHDPALAAAATRLDPVLVEALAATRPLDALARWQSLPADARAASVPGLAAAWSKSDPAAATRWLVAQLPASSSASETAAAPDAKHREALPALVASWFKQAPLDALRWAETLPDPATREIALQGLNYSDQSGLNSLLNLADHAHQAELLSHLQSPSVRAEILGAHLRKWLRADEDAARAWIEAHEALSPEQAAAILTFVSAP